MGHRQDLKHEFFTSKDNPGGGTSSGIGVQISYQDGPLPTSRVQNGAYVEDIIECAIARLEFLNNSRFRCRENSLAITKLEEALHWLDHRTNRRQAAGIEGLHVEQPNA